MEASESAESMMSRDDALREILRIQRWTRPLLQRTVGMTWMIWGIITGGIFVSYEAVGIANLPATASGIALGVVWIPWMLLGVVSTSILWRSVALVLPASPVGAEKTTLIATATFLALAIGGLAVVALAHVPIDGVSFAMIAVGIAAAVVGGSGLTTDARSERAFWLGGGVTLALLAIVVDFVAGRVAYPSEGLLLVLGPLASSALLFGGGLYTAAA